MTRLVPLPIRQCRVLSFQLALSAVMMSPGYCAPLPCRSSSSCLSCRVPMSSDRTVYTHPASAR